MNNPFLAKLHHGATLGAPDIERIEQMTSRRRRVEAGVDLIAEGDRPETVHLILEGWACRYKMLPDGRRQIMSVLLPGDSCDLHVAILREIDHCVGVLSPALVVDIPRETITDIIARHPALTRALWWATLVDEAVEREWLVNMGQRHADRAMAHFFCELLARLRVIGLVRDCSYDVPLTQEDLGDVLGLTAIHVNRTLQQLRRDELVTMKGGRVTVLDEARLQRFSGFKDNYLHLNRRTD